jgi:hypothetical protein
VDTTGYDAYRWYAWDVHWSIPITKPWYRFKIQAGDVVKIIRGASISSDGKVIAGEISVDESMVTGESLPF